MDRKEAVKELEAIKHCEVDSRRHIEALDIAIAALFQPNEPEIELIADEIDSLTWYTINCGEIVEGARDENTAWYKAKDILAVTDSYRRPPEGEEET